MSTMDEPAPGGHHRHDRHSCCLELTSDVGPLAWPSGIPSHERVLCSLGDSSCASALPCTCSVADRRRPWHPTTASCGLVLFPDGLSWLLCDHQQAKLYHSSIRLAGKEASHTLCKPFCPGNFAASSLFLCFLDLPNSTGFCSCRRVQLSSRYDSGSVESSDRSLDALLAPGGAQHRLARLGSPLAPHIPGCKHAPMKSAATLSRGADCTSVACHQGMMLARAKTLPHQSGMHSHAPRPRGICIRQQAAAWRWIGWERIPAFDLTQCLESAPALRRAGALAAGPLSGSGCRSPGAPAPGPGWLPWRAARSWPRVWHQVSAQPGQGQPQPACRPGLLPAPLCSAEVCGGQTFRGQVVSAVSVHPSRRLQASGQRLQVAAEPCVG